jgi:hypothetical protein
VISGEGRVDMADQMLEVSPEIAVIEAVEGSISQEEREFGSLPSGQLLGRYALESFIELVSGGGDSSVEN